MLFSSTDSIISSHKIRVWLIAASWPGLTRKLPQMKQVWGGGAPAAPCLAMERPGADDYDAWRSWAIEVLGQ